LITSISNQYVKLASNLHHKKGRSEHKLYLAEGIHLVSEALKAGAAIQHYFWTEKLALAAEGQELLRQLAQKAQGYVVSESVFAKLSETETPQGILAIVKIPSEPVLDLQNIQLGLIVDGLQDPGNVGTIIRTAWAGGLDCLILTSGTADPYQGKVVRASMGGIFYQKIYRNFSPDAIAAAAHQSGVRIVAGFPGADRSYFSVNMVSPTLLLVGNEGRGVATEWEAYPLEKVFIPQPGNAESLNVSVSAGILIYEAIRQRLTGTMGGLNGINNSQPDYKLDTCKS